MLGLRVGDNMTDSSDNHISPPHMDLIWEPGLFRRLDFGEQGTRLCLNMFALMTYEREMIFDLGDDFKHLYDSFICTVVHSNARGTTSFYWRS